MIKRKWTIKSELENVYQFYSEKHFSLKQKKILNFPIEILKQFKNHVNLETYFISFPNKAKMYT